MNKNKGHIIKNVKPGSIAEEMGLEPGDKIMAVDGTVIEDVFDFELQWQHFPKMSVQTKAASDSLVRLTNPDCLLSAQAGFQLTTSRFRGFHPLFHSRIVPAAYLSVVSIRSIPKRIRFLHNTLLSVPQKNRRLY